MKPLTAKIRQKTFDKIQANLAANPHLDLEIDYSSAVSINRRPVLNVKCNHCGTETTRAAGCLSVAALRCEGCMVLKYTLLAEAVGVKYVRHTSQGVIVSCRNCLSEMTCGAGELRVGNAPRCLTCQERKYADAAHKANWNYLGKVKKHGHGYDVKIQCRVDGAIYTRSSGALVNGFVACEVCRVNNYKQILEKRGCTFLKMLLMSHNYRVQYMNKNGDVFDAATSAITQGSFATDVHSHWANNNSVYLIRLENAGNVYYKIGTASSPLKRMTHLKLEGVQTLFILDNFENRVLANKLESELHTLFSPFQLDPEVAKTFTGRTLKRKRVGQVERVGVKDGVSEWYQDDEVFETLNKRYNLKE